MSMDRQTHLLVTELFTVLERHGYHQHDAEHTDQAITMSIQLSRVYDGTIDTSASTGRHATSQPRPEPRPEPDPDALVLTGGDISTVLAALDLAAEYKRDLAETCADCADQSCASCQYRLKDAQGYDRLANRIYYGPGPAGPPGHALPEPDRPDASPGRAGPDAGKEAGQ